MINIKNIDNNECFQECLVSNLHPADCKQPQITNSYKDFEKENRFEENNSVCISGFGCEKKEKYSVCSSKKYWEQKHVDLLLIGEEGKSHYALIKDFSKFTFYHTLHHGRKLFCCYCLQAFSTEKILKRRIKDCFNFKNEYLKLKSFERKIRSLFIINPDFESILLPEGDEKKNLEKSYSSKHTCGYKQIYNFNKQM